MNKKHYLILVAILSLLISYGCKRRTPPENMVYVPAGDFYMGSDDVDAEAKSLQYGNKKPLFANEGPKKKVYLKDFFIDKYEVSNKRYKKFVDVTKHEAPPYFNTANMAEIENLPVVLVSWFDAKEFCKWEGKRLPAESEWEKGARGADGRKYPWGNEYDTAKVNGAGNHMGYMDVTSLDAGKSPYGAHHMAGNAYEWTASWYERYEGNKYEDADYGRNFMAVRGGSWGGVGHYSLIEYLRTTYRFPVNPEEKYEDLGFRCVKDVE